MPPEPRYFAAIRAAFPDPPEELLDDESPPPVTDAATRSVVGRLVREHEELERALEATLAERDELVAQLAELRAAGASSSPAAPDAPTPDVSASRPDDEPGSAAEPEEWTRERLDRELAPIGWVVTRAVFGEDLEKAMVSPFYARRDADGETVFASRPEQLVAEARRIDRDQPLATRPVVTHGLISTANR